MKSRMLIVCLFFAGALGDASAQEPASRPASRPTGGWWNDVFVAQPLTLGEVLAKPEAWREVPISFNVQFRRAEQHDEVFHTRFDPESWTSFAAWPDEASLWEKPAWDADFPFLFIRRDAPAFILATKGVAYRRLAVTGVVRDVIKGKPWIEVTGLKELPGHLTEAALLH